MNSDDIKDTLKDPIKKAEKYTEDAGSEVAKSGKDWLAYMQDHPLQSVLFGIIAYFALKGMMKD